MNQKAEPRRPSPARVLLAIEHLGPHRGAVALAMRLAQSHGAELTGMLIEDLNLLRAAALPFAYEVVAHGGTVRALDSATLQNRLRLQAQRLQAELGREAAALGVNLTFQVTRGLGVRVALDPQLQAEIIVCGRIGRGPRRPAAPTARVLLVDADAAAAERLEALMSLLTDNATGSGPAAQRIRWNGLQALLDACRLQRPAFLVLPAELLASEELERLMEAAGCPIVLMA